MRPVARYSSMRAARSRPMPGREVSAPRAATAATSSVSVSSVWAPRAGRRGRGTRTRRAPRAGSPSRRRAGRRRSSAPSHSSPWPHGTLRSDVIAAWCWDLLEPYLTRNLLNRGVARPTRKQILEEFGRVWPEITATIGVQEPFAGTIRFKWLVRLPSAEMADFLDDARRVDRRAVRRRQVQDEPAPRPALREHEELQADGGPALLAVPRWRHWTLAPSRRHGPQDARAWGWGPSRGPMMNDMPSDETRRVLKVFGVAVTNLEDADRPAASRWTRS